jgi:hypothetical protein
MNDLNYFFFIASIDRDVLSIKLIFDTGNDDLIHKERVLTISSLSYEWIQVQKNKIMFYTIINSFFGLPGIVLPVWRDDITCSPVSDTKKTKTIIITRFTATDIFQAAASRTIRKAHISSRNRFQDNIERVLHLIPARSLEMKEIRARNLFDSAVVPSIAAASMEMKEKRARRAMTGILPHVLTAAHVVYRAREGKRLLLPDVEKIGRVKSVQRVLLARSLDQDLLDALDARLARARARENFRAIVLEDLLALVSHKAMLVERLRYAVVLEKMMHEIRSRPSSSKIKTSPLDQMLSDPFVLLGITMLASSIAACILLSYIVRYACIHLSVLINTIIDRLEENYTDPSMPRVRHQKKKKMEMRMMKEMARRSRVSKDRRRPSRLVRMVSHK